MQCRGYKRRRGRRGADSEDINSKPNFQRLKVCHHRHQENVIYYGTPQTTTEHYVVLCSKIQPTDGYPNRSLACLGENNPWHFSQAQMLVRIDFCVGYPLNVVYIQCPLRKFLEVGQ